MDEAEQIIAVEVDVAEVQAEVDGVAEEEEAGHSQTKGHPMKWSKLAILRIHAKMILFATQLAAKFPTSTRRFISRIRSKLGKLMRFSADPKTMDFP